MYKWKREAGGMAQVVEHLPSKYKALFSKPHYRQKKKKKKKKKKKNAFRKWKRK
jgi:hypothetical protein